MVPCHCHPNSTRKCHRNSKVLHLAPPCALLLLRWTASASLEPPVAMVRLACYVRLPVYFELRSEGRLGPPRRSLNFEGLFVGRRTQTPDKYFAQTPTGTGGAFAQSAYGRVSWPRRSALTSVSIPAYPGALVRTSHAWCFACGRVNAGALYIDAHHCLSAAIK